MKTKVCGLLRPLWSAEDRKRIYTENLVNARKQFRINVARYSAKEYKEFLDARGAAISKAKVGHVSTDETKRKISESVKRADCRKYKFSIKYLDDAIKFYNDNKYTKKYVAKKFDISVTYFGKLLKKHPGGF